MLDELNGFAMVVSNFFELYLLWCLYLIDTPMYRPRINDFTFDEIEKLKYNLLKIKKISSDSRIVIFTIQSLEEVEEYRKLNKNKLGEELMLFCNENGMEYIDLLKIFSSQKGYSDLFIECDGHWSPSGNQLAAEIVFQHLSK